jgi:hypothetical protein
VSFISTAREDLMKKETGKGATSSPPRKPSAKKTATRKVNAAPRASKNIISAGIKALTNVHEEAIARQSRVFESILGLNTKREPSGASNEKTSNPLTAALDPFGFRKFEDVFDQRVARALENLGVPSAQAFADLQAEVASLRAKIAALEGKKR